MKSVSSSGVYHLLLLLMLIFGSRSDLAAQTDKRIIDPAPQLVVTGLPVDDVSGEEGGESSQGSTDESGTEFDPKVDDEPGTNESLQVNYRPVPYDAILLPSPWMPFLIGPYGGPDFSFHDGSFTTSEDGVVCCEFDKGNGVGFIGGIRSFIPISEKSYISPHIAYVKHTGTFETLGEELPFFGADDSIETLRYLDILTTPIPTVLVEVTWAFKLDSAKGFYVALGPSFEYLISASFHKEERLVAPDGVQFLGGGTERPIEIDYIGEVSRGLLGVRGGAGLLRPITRDIWLNLEVTANVPINTIAENWRIYELQGIVGVLFAL